MREVEEATTQKTEKKLYKIYKHQNNHNKIEYVSKIASRDIDLHRELHPVSIEKHRIL